MDLMAAQIDLMAAQLETEKAKLETEKRTQEFYRKAGVALDDGSTMFQIHSPSLGVKKYIKSYFVPKASSKIVKSKP